MLNLLTKLKNKFFKQSRFQTKTWRNPRMKLEETMYPRFLEVFELDREDYDGAREILDKCIEETYQNVYEEREYEIKILDRVLNVMKQTGVCLYWIVIGIIAVPVVILFFLLLLFSPQFRRKLSSEDPIY